MRLSMQFNHFTFNTGSEIDELLHALNHKDESMWFLA